MEMGDTAMMRLGVVERSSGKQGNKSLVNGNDSHGRLAIEAERIWRVDYNVK